MRNKKAKALRKMFKIYKPWVEYNETTYRKINTPNRNKNLPDIYIVDPITMIDKCGRRLYKGMKKAVCIT